ncbi:hypothetical protein BDZ89DRAFT_1084129 [Hymenopellis radicata]|nr:hypothetical protein BDZ89DRAFT_1084129 [Hymenopellis radicata]
MHVQKYACRREYELISKHIPVRTARQCLWDALLEHKDVRQTFSTWGKRLHVELKFHLRQIDAEVTAEFRGQPLCPLSRTIPCPLRRAGARAEAALLTGSGNLFSNISRAPYYDCHFRRRRRLLNRLSEIGAYMMGWVSALGFSLRKGRVMLSVSKFIQCLCAYCS